MTGKNYSYYLITNTRGDVIETRDGDGNVNAKFVYDSWGKLISVTDGNGNELGTDSFAYQISLKYRGYVYDSETELYYLQSRYYDPEVGRFLNADDVDYIGVSGTVLGYSAFSYCENNAVNGWDPFGNISLSSFSKTWITNLLTCIVGYEVTHRKTIHSIEALGIRIALTQVATYTKNPKAFFTVSKSSVSASLGGLSFSLSKLTFSATSNFSYNGVSVNSFVGISRTYIEFGMLVSQYVQGRRNGCSFGFELAVRVKKIVIATMAVTIVAASLLIPQLSPLFAKGAVVVSNLAAATSINVKSLLTPILYVAYKSFS